MQIFSRRGSEEDVEILKQLEFEARQNLDQFRGGSRLGSEIDVVGDSWQQRINDHQYVVFVAGVDQVVMGFLAARSSNTKAGKIGLIEQVFVTKDARNFGIGDSLVVETIAWAKHLKLVALDALALPGDRETKNLFERSGLVARLITVTKDLTS